ncbi:unnamed protein product [Polarella glacialis]|uniref:Bifunctional lysine-specific demethylase and histidyl-hydroxylase n=1 Tax=Polarella glacialis TaxID=89957 RepID=A0A813GMB3_POLGL|nr:unnamed protein product [Polarella glacialis]
MKKVAKELTHLGREYLASLDDPLRDQRPRLMMWAEVYEPLAFHGPHSHTGVPVVGIFAARCEAGSQDISFEDPRGINPPFGKKERFSLSEGEVLLFPSWASHFLEPNLGNSTNVFISFALEKGRGPQDFDWEDDATGSFVETRVNKIKRGGQKKTSDEQQRTEL